MSHGFNSLNPSVGEKSGDCRGIDHFRQSARIPGDISSGGWRLDFIDGDDKRRGKCVPRREADYPTTKAKCNSNQNLSMEVLVRNKEHPSVEYTGRGSGGNKQNAGDNAGRGTKRKAGETRGRQMQP